MATKGRTLRSCAGGKKNGAWNLNRQSWWLARYRKETSGAFKAKFLLEAAGPQA